MSTAATGSDHGYDAALDGSDFDTIETGDLLDDPRTDAEALCLCSLLWSPTSAARTITTALTESDFDQPIYGELFDVIAEQVQADTPHDPASLAAPSPKPVGPPGTTGSGSPARSPKPPWPGAHPKPLGITPWL